MFQKFGQDVPQSLIDAVSGIMEAKQDEPAAPNADAIARKKKLDALRDKREADAAENDYEKEKPSVRKIAGKAYGGAKQKDDHEDMEEAWAKEELKGNQHKIDANKNGKIDADDFKKLRAGKKDEACDCKEEVESLDEKAVSKAQQKFMGMVYAAKKGGKAASPEVAKAASGMSKKAAHDYAATKQKGLPQHKEETEVVEAKGDDLPFTPDKPHGPIATPGKEGYGPSAARHLARQGLKKFLSKSKEKNETMMGKAGCTSEEVEIEESRGHKILATKLRQINAKIDKMSSGVAPDTHTNPQSTKDKFSDSSNIKKVEIVTQKDTSMHDSAKDNEQDELEMKHKLNKMSHGYGNVQHNEEVEIQETATLDQYIKSMGYDPLHMEKNKKVMFSKTNAFKQWAQRQESLYDAGQKGTEDIDTHMSPGATARG